MSAFYRMMLVGLLTSIFGMAAVSAVVHHHFPLSVGPILMLVPCFLRDMDLVRERPARKLGPLDWSYLAVGCLWVLTAPLL
jgi:hypothetical protein